MFSRERKKNGMKLGGLKKRREKELGRRWGKGNNNQNIFNQKYFQYEKEGAINAFILVLSLLSFYTL